MKTAAHFLAQRQTPLQHTTHITTSPATPPRELQLHDHNTAQHERRSTTSQAPVSLVLSYVVFFNEIIVTSDDTDVNEQSQVP